MQAIILAAGMGRRLGELTKNNNVTLLERNYIRIAIRNRADNDILLRSLHR
jgi:choline kinase